jgi:guanosine-3',5'-bis(diphosphate) 3'-pyrophosphohydrolase
MSDPLPSLLRALVFASQRHRTQSRKDELKTPYVNHLLDVVQVLAENGVRDGPTLVAAALHDVVEDTETTLDEVEAQFGTEVRGLVAEVSDDKRLPRAERKRLQVEHAPHTSAKATLIKLADKIANAWDVGHRPAADWSVERRLDYLSWAARVVERLPPVAPALTERFHVVHAEGVEVVMGARGKVLELGRDRREG